MYKFYDDEFWDGCGFELEGDTSFGNEAVVAIVMLSTASITELDGGSI
jgi:hypothetical protein